MALPDPGELVAGEAAEQLPGQVEGVGDAAPQLAAGRRHRGHLAPSGGSWFLGPWKPAPLESGCAACVGMMKTGPTPPSQRWARLHGAFMKAAQRLQTCPVCLRARRFNRG